MSVCVTEVGAFRPLARLFSAAALRKLSGQILIVPPSQFIYRIKELKGNKLMPPIMSTCVVTSSLSRPEILK